MLKKMFLSRKATARRFAEFEIPRAVPLILGMTIALSGCNQDKTKSSGWEEINPAEGISPPIHGIQNPDLGTTTHSPLVEAERPALIPPSSPPVIKIPESAFTSFNWLVFCVAVVVLLKKE